MPDAPVILIVDDDQGLCRLIDKSLKRDGFVTAIASSGQDAIAWLVQHQASLMLLDLKLQDIEGKELINQLAHLGRPVPFVIITGQGDERVAVEMMKRGALDYLVKDVNLVEFVPTVVRRALAQLEREQRVSKVEAQLDESEQRFRSTLDNMMEGCQTIGFDWRYLYVNKAAARHARREIAELVGRKIMDVYPEIEKTRLFAQLQECMINRITKHVETKFVYPDGDSAWFQSSIQPVPEGLFILSLDITERKKLEQTLLDVSESEQRKFGHDLHDGLGQRLTGLEMLSNALAEDLKGHPALAKQALRLNSELRETITQARLISHSLAPVPLHGDGLMLGLAELAASTSRIPGIKCRFLCDPPVRVEEVMVATHLYRIAQEAVNNALKHGQAKRIEIALHEQPEGLELSVENNGLPMPPEDHKRSGTGLNVMNYRAGMIGGTLSIVSNKNKGVRVACTLRKK